MSRVSIIPCAIELKWGTIATKLKTFTSAGGTSGKNKWMNVNSALIPREVIKATIWFFVIDEPKIPIEE